MYVDLYKIGHEEFISEIKINIGTFWPARYKPAVPVTQICMLYADL